ncbi:MAG: hypothetical protein Q4D65_05485 [Peptostreptococcaceae bacterium]|nr:hypothetical protein [Peptostreptococcaceae bacterium]
MSGLLRNLWRNNYLIVILCIVAVILSMRDIMKYKQEERNFDFDIFLNYTAVVFAVITIFVRVYGILMDGF